MENNSRAYYTIGFDGKERLELLEIFKDNPKWKKRIDGSFGFLVNLNAKVFGDGFQNCVKCGRQSTISGIVEKYHWICPNCKNNDQNETNIT